MKKKICLISSSGGHFEQLMILKKLSDDNEVYIITERTEYLKSDDINYISQINRKEKSFLFKFIKIFFESLYIFLKEKPDVIISTGALCTIPTFLLGKIFNKQLIFIESFAKINSPTLTGRLLYKISDTFIVQWEDMKEIYPKAIYLGSIY